MTSCSVIVHADPQQRTTACRPVHVSQPCHESSDALSFLPHWLISVSLALYLLYKFLSIQYMPGQRAGWAGTAGGGC